ncbi:TRAP transporter substrate-binding protein [uncultured Oscillibacter sp.]|uniref:TRAP transporter substrate-binding protein n=1 Tax=uncultured Oscillibacter sp. TaxID=876091 RepID=UPI0025D32BA6|nr:TRAP transporter substrate-binding protein [uncultured Oscillibacter sp.]
MKRRISLLLTLILAIGMLSGCGGKQPDSSAAPSGGADAGAASGDTASGSSGSGGAEYVIRGATSNVESHPHYLGLVKFSELLDEKSGGRIKLETFHSGTLGSERDIVEGMQLNTIEVGAITSGPLSGFTDSFLVFDLPFLFENVTIARKVCDSEVGQEMLASVEPSGLKGLGFFENGMRSVTNNLGPIETPADCKGMKIRTMENPMHMATFSVMGADPTPMAFGELYTALQQGAMDAQENPYTVIYSSKFYEVQKYLSITEHLYSPTALLMSLDFYNSLPADLQEVVMEAAAEASVYQRQCCDEQEAMLLEELEKEGMIINKPDKAPFIEATASLYDTYVGDKAGLVSPDQLAKVREIIAEG